MKSLGTHRLALATFAALVGLGLGGCAASSGPHAEPAATAEQEKIDPWEGGNRKVFAFNEAVDNRENGPTEGGAPRDRER